MNSYYIAAFMPEKEGGYSIVIPDVPNCFTCADTLDEGMYMAADVLTLMLQDMAANKQAIPAPSSLDAVKDKMTEHMRELNLPLPDDTLYQLIQAPSLDMVPVKVMISLPKALLQDMDTRAKAMGYTRSGYIARAVNAYQSQTL